MNKTTIIFNLLIIFQLIACASCRKYIAPNNHDYNKASNIENAKFIKSVPKLQLTTSERFAIPSISTESKEHIKDFTPPNYAKEGFTTQTNDKSSTKSNKKMRVQPNLDKKEKSNTTTDLNPKAETSEDIDDDTGSNAETLVTENENNEDQSNKNYKENDLDLNLEEID